MKKNLILFTLLLTLFACSTESTPEIEAIDSLPIEFLEEPKEEIDNRIRVEFDDLSLMLDFIDMGWDVYNSFDDKLYQTDSIAFFNLSPGEGMMDKNFTIEESDYDEVELFVQLVNQVTIYTDREMEDSDCILYDWKDYTSPWVQVDIKNGILKFDSQTEIYEEAIEYTLDELKKAVLENCGEDWYEEIDDINDLESIRTYEVNIQYTYKIVATSTQTGKTVIRKIVFYSPTSC